MSKQQLRKRESFRRDKLRRQHDGWLETHCDSCGSTHMLEFTLPEHDWACEACGERVEKVYGCLSCTRVLCAKCVPCYGEGDLEYIGGMLGVTRERVRQIEGVALRKLRAVILRHPQAIEEVW